jgi:hypothetical protein
VLIFRKGNLISPKEMQAACQIQRPRLKKPETPGLFPFKQEKLLIGVFFPSRQTPVPALRRGKTGAALKKSEPKVSNSHE